MRLYLRKVANKKSGNYRQVSPTTGEDKLLQGILRRCTCIWKEGLIRDSQRDFVLGRSLKLKKRFYGPQQGFCYGSEWETAWEIRLYVIQGDLADWIKNWLVGKKQSVVMDGC